LKHKLFNKIKKFKKGTWEIIILFICFIILSIFDIEITFITGFIACMSAVVLGYYLKRIIEKHSDNSG